MMRKSLFLQKNTINIESLDEWTHLTGWASIRFIGQYFHVMVVLLFLLVIPNISDKAQADDKTYVIQVGAFIAVDYAQDEVNRLKKMGYDALYILETNKDQRKWYKVYVAGYDTKVEAEQEAKRLKGIKAISGYCINILGDKKEINKNHISDNLNGPHIASKFSQTAVDTPILNKNETQDGKNQVIPKTDPLTEIKDISSSSLTFQP